ncbi:MAG: hypothetical protein ACK424_06460, partial [Candidatus Thermochlorobacter sp.]
TIDQFGKNYWGARSAFAKFANNILNHLRDFPACASSLFRDTRWHRIVKLDIEKDQSEFEQAVKLGTLNLLIDGYVAALLELQSFLQAKALMVEEKSNGGMRKVALHDLERLAIESGLTKPQWDTALKEARNSQNYSAMLKLNPFDDYALAGIIETLYLQMCDLFDFDSYVLATVSEKMERKATYQADIAFVRTDYSLWFRDDPTVAASSADEHIKAAAHPVITTKSEASARKIKAIWSEQNRRAGFSSPKLKSAEEILAPYRHILSELEPYMEKVWFLLLKADEKDAKHLDLTRCANYGILMDAAARYEVAVVVVKALTSAIPPCVQDVEAIHISTEREKLIPLFAFIAAIIFFFLVFFLVKFSVFS